MSKKVKSFKSLIIFATILAIISMFALLGNIGIMVEGLSKENNMLFAYGLTGIVSSVFLIVFSLLVELFVNLEKQSMEQVELLEQQSKIQLEILNRIIK